jgi:hypothetical protein
MLLYNQLNEVIARNTDCFFPQYHLVHGSDLLGNLGIGRLFYV